MCLLISVLFADNTVSFRVECVSVACLTLGSPITVVVMTSDCAAGGFTYATLEAAELKWRYCCAESGLSFTLRVQGERTGGRLSWGGRLSGCGLELLEASVCVTILQCGFTSCEFPSVHLRACVRTLHMFVRWSDKGEENPFECKGQSNQMCI